MNEITTGSKCLQVLLEKAKESPNQICNKVDRASPLHFAVLVNNIPNVKLLLKHSAQPNIKDNLGNTPMHMAVAQRNVNLVKVLDTYNADARIKNIDGVSAIDIAITEDLRDIKLHFMSQPKYKDVNFAIR